MDELQYRRELGSAIREKRQALGFSQESFADAVGLHRTYIGGIERGERTVSLCNLLRIAQALSLPLSSLLAQAENNIETLGEAAK
jgi:transcriptional regulator with XRE-family HTH domain